MNRWWITDGPLENAGTRRVLGPFESKDLAIQVRTFVEKAEGHSNYWVGEEPENVGERIEDLRRQVTAYDNARQGESGLSVAMMSALNALPIRCPDGLPVGSPSEATLMALERRDLAKRLIIRGEQRWVRTTLGEAAWANR